MQRTIGIVHGRRGRIGFRKGKESLKLRVVFGKGGEASK